MDDAEDDTYRIDNSAAGADPTADAVDDADNVRRVHPQLRDGIGPLLDRLEYRWHCHSGSHHGLGPYFIAS